MRAKTSLAALVGTAVAVAAAVLMVAPIAMAHHPEIYVSLDCNGLVSYTVSADVNDSSRNNPDVRVYDDAQLTHQVGSGAFTNANQRSFTGSYSVSTSVTSVTLWPYAVGAWGNPSASHPTLGPSFTAHRPTNCKLPSTTVTAIHNAAHGVVTSVAVGSVVHDSVTVSGSGVTPTGNVTFDWFTNGSCAGNPAATSGDVALSGGSADATGFPQTVSSAGSYGFKAHYQGNSKYSPSDGDCEPLTAVDARITIGQSGTNPVNSPHTFTVFVEKNDGTGWSAASGVTINSTASGVGSITGGSCGPTGATSAAGTCTVIVNSSVPGTTTVNASGTVTVNTVSIAVSTSGYGAHDISNVKQWADAAVRTDIHNASHEVVTSVASGTVVHDKVFVTKLAGTPAGVPNPTGNVVFHRYTTIGCTGQSVDQTVAIAADGTAETSAFTATANMSYKADYQGDNNYPARSGACEPLTVTTSPTPPTPPSSSNPAIAITKNPKEQSVAAGASVTWTIVVTNTGNVTLTNVRVVDPEAPDCAKTSAQIPALSSMAPGASLSYTCTRANVTVSFTNVATDIGTPPSGSDVTATDSAHVTVTPLTPPTPPTPPKPPVVKVIHPKIMITKNPKSQTVAIGVAARWTIKVKNTGDVVLKNVTVTDPKAPQCNRKFNGTLGVGKSRTYTCAKPNTRAKYTNVALVVGTAPNGKKVTDKDAAIVKTAPLKPKVIVKKAKAKPKPKPTAKPKPKPKPPSVVSHNKPKTTG